ncbi:MAG TPA: IS4 family transposase [Bacteroidales bacterium]|nr:IS4 family transposase [Bacteroidales bacterium]
MNEGKYIFTQVTSLIPRQIFQRLVKRYNGDYRVRDFNCTNQLRYMLFGQLTSCNSLRDICLCLRAHQDILYGLGITASVNESTLSRANDSRDYRIYEGLGQALMKIVRPLYSKERIEYIYPQNHDLFALDSTTISCSLKLMEWALGKYSKGAVKMHTVIDLRGSIPTFIHISDGRCHDSNVLDLLNIIPNAIYTMDKAYVDFEALARIDAEYAFFVTRAKDNMRFEIISSNFNIDKSTGLLEDHIIRLTSQKSSQLYPEPLRLIRFYDMKSEEILSFISNVTDQVEISGLEIANIYRHRWDIESFFKLIKQNLTIKHLLGCSQNAVKTHLWIAICAYLLLARVKAIYNSPYSITEIGTLVSVFALVKMDLKELITEPQPLIQNQDVNELTLF